MPAPDSLVSGRIPAAAGMAAAAAAASCCLLPLALITIGVAGSGLMMTAMRYEWFTLPLGVFGLGGAYALYFRDRRSCSTAGCHFVGERGTRITLALASIIVAASLLLKFFPTWTAELLQRL